MGAVNANIDGSLVTGITMPEGEVVEIRHGETIIWAAEVEAAFKGTTEITGSSGLTTLGCVHGSSVGGQTPVNLVAARAEYDHTDGIVVSVRGGLAAYYDDGAGEYKTISVDILPHAPSGTIVGFTIRLLETTTTNGSNVVFKGTYEWSFDI